MVKVLTLNQIPWLRVQALPLTSGTERIIYDSRKNRDPTLLPPFASPPRMTARRQQIAF